jgi:tetratricopeptide (TPR) repeat protein
MQTAANISLVLTDSSSLKRFADLETAISYGEFYQLIASGLTRGVQNEEVFRVLGNRLVGLAEHSYALRQVDALEQVSQVLVNSPLRRQYKTVGRYYQALCVQRFGSGDVEEAARLLESVAENAPPRYRARAIQSLGSNSFYRGDHQSALSLYGEAARFASCSKIYDAYATLGTLKMAAIINALEGNHRDATALLENLFPLARSVRSSHPHVYYDYMNSLAVELCEVGRLEEAEKVSQIVLASSFASAYPEWRETHDEIELRGLRASRSVVALSTTIAADAPFSHPAADAFVSPAPLEGGNLVRLPLANRGESLAPVETSPAGQPARVLSMQNWKEKMAKENDDPHKRRSRPTTSEEKAARLDEMETLGTRGMLLRAMEMLGDERVTDDQLRRALIILEGLESDENPGA